MPDFNSKPSQSTLIYILIGVIGILYATKSVPFLISVILSFAVIQFMSGGLSFGDKKSKTKQYHKPQNNRTHPPVTEDRPEANFSRELKQCQSNLERAHREIAFIAEEIKRLKTLLLSTESDKDRMDLATLLEDYDTELKKFEQNRDFYQIAVNNLKQIQKNAETRQSIEASKRKLAEIKRTNHRLEDHLNKEHQQIEHQVLSSIQDLREQMDKATEASQRQFVLEQIEKLERT